MHHHPPHPQGFYATHARAISEAIHGEGAACLKRYTCTNLTTPSGSLVKALLVNSAHGMQAWEGADGTVDLSSAPDKYQGFGRVALNTSLPTVLRASPQAGASALFIGEWRCVVQGPWCCVIQGQWCCGVQGACCCDFL